MATAEHLSTVVASVFANGGPLARALPGFEPREGQRAMAEAVASVVESGGTLLAEAGTGTGKTLAYLVPAILSRQRVLVSTGTKNLQEQIFFKDLPALRDALGIPFTATLMKGRGNFLCLHRWQLYESQPASSLTSFVPLEMIRSWVARTKTGDRAELRDLPEDLPLWKEIAAEAESCLGTECPRYGDCFITLMRQRAAESDVVIVNHHLLCADASVRQGEYGEVIPSCPTLIVDEAHQLEDVATQYFGVTISNFRIEQLVHDAARVAGSRPHDAEEMRRAVERVADRCRTFFGGLAQQRGLFRPAGETGEARTRYDAEGIAEHFEAGMMLAGALDGLEATAVLSRPPGGSDPADGTADVVEALASIQRRAAELRNDLRFLMRADEAGFVYFGEARGRGLLLRASPIDVSRVVRDTILARQRATVMTSATLAIEGTFEYVRHRLGVRDADEVRVASEFDFARQALLYLPRRMPPPNAPAFPEAAAREVIELLKRSRGRAFVLFTSYAVLRTVQRFVEMSLPYPILVQGSAPRSALVEQFRGTANAVLLATSSFWQGVDVVGDALSCVIVDKLPFASPGDPVTAARIDSLKAEGRDAFSEYQVPLAILALQQGLGRLIRHRTDRGVFAVLDPRIRTMGYGRRFLASLPAAPVTHDLEAVDRFFR